MPTPIVGNIQRNWNRKDEDCGKMLLVILGFIIIGFIVIFGGALAIHTMKNWEMVSACFMDKSSPICVEWTNRSKIREDTERNNYLKQVRCVTWDDGHKQCFTNYQLKQYKALLNMINNDEL